jgi:uncharacterized protein (DUF1778 family)
MSPQDTSSTLNIRIKAEERDLIDRAAKVQGKNRSDFILDAARRAAENALLDQAVMLVEPKAYAAFLERLDLPPQPNRRLLKTMQTIPPLPGPWCATPGNASRKPHRR